METLQDGFKRVQESYANQGSLYENVKKQCTIIGESWRKLIVGHEKIAQIAMNTIDGVNAAMGLPHQFKGIMDAEIEADCGPAAYEEIKARNDQKYLKNRND